MKRQSIVITLLTLTLLIDFSCKVKSVSDPAASTSNSNTETPIHNPNPNSSDATRSQKLQQIGFLNDFANVLDKNTKEQIESTLTEFKNNAKIDFVVVIVKTTGSQSVFDYSLALAQDWSVGANNPDKAGLLLLVAVEDRKWHIQISRVLEKVLSNEEVAELGSIMKEPFHEGNYGEGIRKCVESFISILTKRRGIANNKA